MDQNIGSVTLQGHIPWKIGIFFLEEQGISSSLEGGVGASQHMILHSCIACVSHHLSMIFMLLIYVLHHVIKFSN